jgi:hypothetical protein
MTVCIAAICALGQGGMIVVGASDRMLSGSDIQFEPPQTKIYQFLPSVIALVAGDPYDQMSICEATARHIRLSPRPPTTVADVAKIYADAFTAHRRRVAETKILVPHGLDANELMNRQQDFRREVVADLMHRMETCELGVETIVTGVDSDGSAHIFVVTDPGQIACADAIAFASIGTGKQHADSQFMLAHHTRSVPWQRALLSTYIAKKRAEIAPTVGRTHTDLFFVGSEGYRAIADPIHDAIRKTWGKLEQVIALETEKSSAGAHQFIDDYLRRLQEPPASEAAPRLATEAAPPQKRPKKRTRRKPRA